MKIRIEDSLEITLEWNCSSTDKEAFLYLVAFKLATGKVNDLHDILFRDIMKEDGLEYLSIKKSSFLSSNTLTQTIKLNAKGIRNAIEDIYFLLLSFKNDNIAKGKIVLKSDGKRMEYKYEVSSSQHLCIEFGHMKRCSDYWELNLYTQEYKSIEIPYRIFATKKLKEEHPASEVFKTKKEMALSGRKSEGEFSINEDVEIPVINTNNWRSGSKLNSKKKKHGAMPTSKIAAKDKISSGSTSNSQEAEITLSEAEVIRAKSTATDNKKKTKNSSKGIMPYKSKK